jgi:hypothetical protein
VGIFYLVGNELLTDVTTLGCAERYGDFLVHARSHEEYWASLRAKGLGSTNAYEDCPRGRVAFDLRHERFVLLADRCLLNSRRHLQQIITRLQLRRGLVNTSTDAHYRCEACLRSDGSTEKNTSG